MLNNLGLQGQLPASFGQLVYLQRLAMWNNQLFGELVGERTAGREAGRHPPSSMDGIISIERRGATGGGTATPKGHFSQGCSAAALQAPPWLPLTFQRAHLGPSRPPPKCFTPPASHLRLSRSAMRPAGGLPWRALAGLTQLHTLQLSANLLAGQLPRVANIPPALRVLDLQYNALTGAPPVQAQGRAPTPPVMLVMRGSAGGVCGVGGGGYGRGVWWLGGLRGCWPPLLRLDSLMTRAAAPPCCVDLLFSGGIDSLSAP